jgi:hypothetical protein
MICCAEPGLKEALNVLYMHKTCVTCKMRKKMGKKKERQKELTNGQIPLTATAFDFDFDFGMGFPVPEGYIYTWTCPSR